MNETVLVQLDIPYDKRESLNDDATWEKFCANWPLAEEKMNRKDHPSWAYLINCGPTRVTLQEANELLSLGFKINVVPLPGAMITKMQDRHKWEWSAGVTPDDLQNGRAVQITIPDVGLLRINEVMVAEDYCTNSLQDLLDEGWRILAVCPPNAARRPDYILGRTKGA